MDVHDVHDAHGAASAHPLDAALARAHHVLPDQGPIGVFIHHNTLHAFQHLPFHDGVQQGASLLGARPYLSLDEFRAAWRAGRIETRDVDDEVDAELGAAAHHEVAAALPGLTEGQLWRALMLEDVDLDDAAGLAFAVDNGSSPLCAHGALWEAACARAARAPLRPLMERAPLRRHRDALLRLGARDTDEVVHSELVRLCAGALDQGQAEAPLPLREQGFLAAVGALHASGAPVTLACRPADGDLAAAHARGIGARALVLESLMALGVDDGSMEDLVLATALALPGWSGMFSRLERHSSEDRAHVHASLLELLAVRLCYERRAVERACAEVGAPVAWSALRARAAEPPAREVSLDALPLFFAARACALAPAALATLPDEALAAVWATCTRATPLVRRRLFQEAYERRYRRQILDAVAALRRHTAASSTEGAAARAQAQFVFCIDEREESIRRALEEQGPAFTTFGTAGFFGVAIDYQGLYDREPAPHAPVVVTPGHEVHEAPVFTERDWHVLRDRMRSAWHTVERTTASGSRGLLGGAGASLVLGPLAGALATARVVAPRLSLALRDSAEAWLAPVPVTHLLSLRAAEGELHTARGKPVGFSLDEAADRVANTLKNIGLTQGFAPIVVFLGHGSTSLNNPHESAHDCGACGGRRGGANARLFAELANRPDVRAAVKQRGVSIPADTWFVGALHDTANDDVTCYELASMPPHAMAPFDAARAALDRARRDSALERCRRFHHAPLGITPNAALAHVQARASHLAQPRPEYGHCTNAIAIVGRRQATRGLFLDRRPFLVSYDPTTDTDDVILERILAAVGPVGAGISLEYYFSSVDNEVFGCGTKLPHNVTGLLGVMNGHQGDLRTGLPLQMVEIHEPMRLLLIVEATPASLLAVAGRQAEVRELVVNRWVQLVSQHPETGALAFFDKGTATTDAGFVPYAPDDAPLPVVERSVDWFKDTREHLPPALVTRALRTTLTPTRPA